MAFRFILIILEIISLTNSQSFRDQDYFTTLPFHGQYHRGGVVGLGYNHLEYRKVFVQPPTPAPVVEEVHDIQQMFTDIFNWNNDLTKDSRFTGCPVPNISEISAASPKSSFFFGLNPAHRMASMRLKTIIMGGKDLQDVVCLAGALRDTPGINANAWIRSVFGAHLTHAGLSGLTAPPLVEVMPHIFLNREALQSARNQGTGSQAGGCNAVVDGRAGSDNAEENLLWYFREDLQVNAFHLNWHLIYPISPEVKADRQGELFYFTHHSHLARYRAERLATGLGPLTPLHLDYNIPIREGYNPHLDDTTSGMSWTPRSRGLFVQDTLFESPTNSNASNDPRQLQQQPPGFISVANQSLLIARVQNSILHGALLLPDGRIQPINSISGIDLLGDLVEATSFTINGDYYGSFGFHNEGHVLVGFIQDPQNVTNRPPGVMAEVATAMRDPVFYRYHAAVDETFTLHKELLPPYAPQGGELPLKWDAVWVERFEVEEGSTDRSRSTTRPLNQLTTFFTQTSYELSRGLDFQRSGRSSVAACVQHLDHNPFTYRIYVGRKAPHRLAPAASTVTATVRIFMAPRMNENGLRYTLLEQRHLFFMMDLFTVSLSPGLNLITRLSTESSLTTSRPTGGNANTNQEPQYCGCGWPQHVLLPRGTERGMDFDLFVMLTNAAEDSVASNNTNRTPNQGCGPAPIYCGRMNDTYPDAKPMNYPFDRLPYTVVETTTSSELLQRYVHDLDEYAQPIPNMANVKVTITHLGTQAQRPAPATGAGAPSTSNQPITTQRQDGVELSQQFLNVPRNEITEEDNYFQRSSRVSNNRIRKKYQSPSSPQSQQSKSTTFFSNPFMQYSYSLF